MVPCVRYALIAAAGCLAVWGAGERIRAEPPWERSAWFDEFSYTQAFDPAGRMHVNAPADEAGKPAKATRLIVYTLPNGNTIEQTLGCRMTEGLDWHYDIQHVAAQVRLLRTLLPDERIVLICAEADGLSWPNWRRTQSDANQKIAGLLDGWRETFGAGDCKVFLTGHSGGGSFMFGVIEGNEEIPSYIDRIAFLDANYSFDAKMHADKLARWLNGDPSHRLIVLAYDDREITLNGKKVVGPTGGTFRATGRMRDALGEVFDLLAIKRPPFQETVGLGGRIHFYVHTNPENKILHTALVGEMNGLVQTAMLGIEEQEDWGTFGGPRAYTKWMQPAPTVKELGQQGDATGLEETPASSKSRFPPRPADALGGREFINRIKSLSLDDREAAILKEIESGNFPQFLREFQSVAIRGSIQVAGEEVEIKATLEVMPDYLAVGSDDDFARMPMTPQTAQRIADTFGCTLPTRKMVDAIDAAAELRLAPHPLTEDRESVRTFLKHHNIIEEQRGGETLGQLICGIKKDIVITPRIHERPERLAIYGWRKPGGEPIQPLTIVHWDRYVDYSHGARLVRDEIDIEGQQVKVTALLADPDRCGLVSDEGPMTPPRYPLDE